MRIETSQTLFDSNQRGTAWGDAIALLVWSAAGVVAFLPFAFNTSPWDAVRFQVPENQGNWWHLLVGVPFFLAFPMIWLRLRALFAPQRSTTLGRRILWVAVAGSILGTVAVETPFLLHLAGTSDWQRLAVLGLGLGIIAASAVVLFLARGRIAPTHACIIGLETAYLANAALCLVVYSQATGSIRTRSGWMVSMVIFWPVLLELAWLLIRSLRGSTAIDR
jgi:hypothetical protein